MKHDDCDFAEVKEIIEEIQTKVTIAAETMLNSYKEMVEKDKVHDSQIQEIYGTMQELRAFTETQSQALKKASSSLEILTKRLDGEWKEEIIKASQKDNERLFNLVEMLAQQKHERKKLSIEGLIKVTLSALTGGGVVYLFMEILAGRK